MNPGDLIKKLNQLHAQHEVTALPLTDLTQRYQCSCGEILSLPLSKMMAASGDPEAFIRSQNARFDVSDLRLLRDQALADLKAFPPNARMRGMSGTLTDGDVIALSYYKASVSLLRMRGFLPQDVPMPKLYHPDSDCDEEGFAIESGKQVKVRVPR